MWCMGTDENLNGENENGQGERWETVGEVNFR